MGGGISKKLNFIYQCVQNSSIQFLTGFILRASLFLKFWPKKPCRTKLLALWSTVWHFVSNVDKIGIQLSNLPYFSLIFLMFLVNTCLLNLAIFLRFSYVLTNIEASFLIKKSVVCLLQLGVSSLKTFTLK